MILARIILAFLIWQSVAAYSADTMYRRVSMPEGIAIDLPKHWLVHSDAEKSNFAAASEGASRSAGIAYDTKEDVARLLAVSSLPTPSAAKIRITVVRNPPVSGGDLSAVTESDLRELQSELTTELSSSMAAIGGKLLSMSPLQVVRISGKLAILIEYRRTDARAASPWLVRMYRIPVKDKQINFTVSYRESDALIFRPILDHVVQSLSL